MDNAAPHQQLDQMITGYWVSQAIYAAAKFDVAEHLSDGPMLIDDLAAATSTNPDALYRLGASLGELGQTREACVTLAEVSARFPGSAAATEAQTARGRLACE